MTYNVFGGTLNLAQLNSDIWSKKLTIKNTNKNKQISAKHIERSKQIKMPTTNPQQIYSKSNQWGLRLLYAVMIKIIAVMEFGR